jgi:hypothetical protein
MSGQKLDSGKTYNEAMIWAVTAFLICGLFWISIPFGFIGIKLSINNI